MDNRVSVKLDFHWNSKETSEQNNILFLEMNLRTTMFSPNQVSQGKYEKGFRQSPARESDEAHDQMDITPRLEKGWFQFRVEGKYEEKRDWGYQNITNSRK